MNKIIGIIPARGGSKGIPQKNIKLLKGFPLIAYSIIASKLSQTIERTIVSTDSQEIAEISKHYGAEVPFLRPEQYATDSSRDIEWITHALAWFRSRENITPKYLVHLRPTSPIRHPLIIDKAIHIIQDNDDCTGLRSVSEMKEHIYKCFYLDGVYLEGLNPSDQRPEYYNLPRQVFRPIYKGSGYIDIIKTDTVLNNNLLHGSKILAFITDFCGELDAIDDFDYLEWLIDKYGCEILDYLKANY